MSLCGCAIMKACCEPNISEYENRQIIIVNGDLFRLLQLVLEPNETAKTGDPNIAASFTVFSAHAFPQKPDKAPSDSR